MCYDNRNHKESVKTYIYNIHYIYIKINHINHRRHLARSRFRELPTENVMRILEFPCVITVVYYNPVESRFMRESAEFVRGPSLESR